jgi:hypothetical protein
VYDLDAEGISLVGNYRTQCNSIIVRSSYSELVEEAEGGQGVAQRRVICPLLLPLSVSPAGRLPKVCTSA